MRDTKGLQWTPVEQFVKFGGLDVLINIVSNRILWDLERNKHFDIYGQDIL